MSQALITRESDGLRFEPTVQPGMVRCEACLMLVEPSKVREHTCIEWWTPEYVAREMNRLFPLPKK